MASRGQKQSIVEGPNSIKAQSKEEQAPRRVEDPNITKPTEDPELKKLQIENDRLKLERENAQLRSEIAAVVAPWWRKSSTVTTLTAILAAVIPATTAVQGYYEKSTQLALQTSKQDQDLRLERQRQTEQIRAAYLDRLNNDGALFRTLRFVAATSDDPNMREWASKEEGILNTQMESWRKEVTKQEEIASSFEKMVKDAEAANQAENLRQKAELAKKRLEELRIGFDTLAKACNCAPGDPLCSCL